VAQPVPWLIFCGILELMMNISVTSLITGRTHHVRRHDTVQISTAGTREHERARSWKREDTDKLMTMPSVTPRLYEPSTLFDTHALINKMSRWCLHEESDSTRCSEWRDRYHYDGWNVRPKPTIY
jgi:hypothetical protein